MTFNLAMRRLAMSALIVTVMSLMPLKAFAHATSTGLATLDLRESAMQLSLSLPLGEFDPPARDTVAKAAVGDTASASQLGQWLRTQMTLTQGGQACQWRRIRLQTAPADSARLVVLAHVDCPVGAPNAVLRDGLSAVFGEHYRSIVSITNAAGQRFEHVLDRDNPEVALDSAQTPRAWALFWLGMAHIASGMDHLLFIFVLVLAAVASVQVQPTPAYGRPISRLTWSQALMVAKPLALQVTTFTLAHSASLAMATLNWLRIPAGVVEPLIALSIIWVASTAWLALRPSQTAQHTAGLLWRELAVVFAFGLVHGWAFSEALTELRLSGAALLWALLSFNLGVEAAQLLVLILVAPALLLLRRHPDTARVLPWLACAAGASGMFWLVERLV
jgi:hypothetical protein